MSDYICKKCSGKMALYSTFTGEWDADSEPYTGGVQECAEVEYVHFNVYLSAVICPHCLIMEWLSIEDSDGEIESICEHVSNDKNKHRITLIMWLRSAARKLLRNFT
jgi:hypothetical protein